MSATADIAMPSAESSTTPAISSRRFTIVRITLGVDLAALLALALARPRSAMPEAEAQRGTLTQPPRFASASHAIIPLTAAAILLALTGVGSWIYGSPAAALSHLRGESLTVSPDYLDFGSGKPGDVIERTVTV